MFIVNDMGCKASVLNFYEITDLFEIFGKSHGYFLENKTPLHQYVGKFACNIKVLMDPSEAHV